MERRGGIRQVVRLRRVPPPVRLLYRWIGRRAYTRETAALRAGLPEPSPTA